MLCWRLPRSGSIQLVSWELLFQCLSTSGSLQLVLWELLYRCLPRSDLCDWRGEVAVSPAILDPDLYSWSCGDCCVSVFLGLCLYSCSCRTLIADKNIFLKTVSQMTIFSDVSVWTGRAAVFKGACMHGQRGNARRLSQSTISLE